MHLVIVRKSADSSENNSDTFLRLAFSSEPLTDIVVAMMSGSSCLRPNSFALALPREWRRPDAAAYAMSTLYYDTQVPVSPFLSRRGSNSWFVVSNGGFITKVDAHLLHNVMAQTSSGVIAVNVEPNLRAGCEKVLVDKQRNLVGFRPLYADAVHLAPVGPDWPHHLFVSSDLVSRLFGDGTLPVAFGEFVDKCRSISTAIRSLNMGGVALNLNTEQGLLGIVSAGFVARPRHLRVKDEDDEENGNDAPGISTDARLYGEIAFGRSVSIGAKAIVAGPAVICEEAWVAGEAVVRECIIGPGITVPPGCVVQNRVVADSTQISLQIPDAMKEKPTAAGGLDLSGSPRGDAGDVSHQGRFRAWPTFSYARCIKRIADVIAAVFVLFIFAPVLPVIAMAIKLTSRGPVFYKGVRQGLHGRPFTCLKFRTMLVGSDVIQEKLRIINEADGPQFMIADDPRISKVGRFLRDTYLDEVPQFFNVLVGQMSVVGPRPSPEAENIMCPFWRDARLSVRPGITGLWQVLRTRRPMRDFQEWIHYDIEYVRRLSLGLDLWICWRTFKKMCVNFIRQF